MTYTNTFPFFEETVLSPPGRAISSPAAPIRRYTDPTSCRMRSALLFVPVFLAKVLSLRLDERFFPVILSPPLNRIITHYQHSKISLEFVGLAVQFPKITALKQAAERLPALFSSKKNTTSDTISLSAVFCGFRRFKHPVRIGKDQCEIAKGNVSRLVCAGRNSVLIGKSHGNPYPRIIPVIIFEA